MLNINYDDTHHAYVKEDWRSISFSGESRWDQDYRLYHEFTYDNATGNMLSKKTSLKNSSGSSCITGYASDLTEYQYDYSGRCTKVKIGGSDFKIYTYDDNFHDPGDYTKNSLKITDTLGNYTYQTYDGLDRLIEERVYDSGSNLRGQKKYEYDPVFIHQAAKDKLFQTADAAGISDMVITWYIYDPLGRLLQVKKKDDTDNYRLVSEIIYYDNDNPCHATVKNYRDTNSSHYSYKESYYDWNNCLTRVIEHDVSAPDKTTDVSGATYYYYDESGNRIQVANAEGISTYYAYNTAGRMERMQYPGSVYEYYLYDANGNLTQKTDRKTNTLYYQYDSLNRLRAVTDNSNYILKYDYDQFGGRKNTKKIVSGQTEAESQYTINGRGLVTQVIRKVGVQPSYNKDYQLDYSYDNANNPDQLTVRDSAGNIVKTLDYDPGVQTSLVKDGANNIASITHRFDGAVDHITYGASVLTTSYGYDEMLRPTSINCGALMTNSYTYDFQGNVRTWNGKTYLYDGLDRMIKETIDSEYTEYFYDRIGNRTGENTAYTNKTYNYNTYKTRLTSVGNFTYGYDDNGNQTSKTENGNSWIYTYDPENHLTQVTQNSTEVGRYYYNADGLRTKKVEDGKTTIYVYNGSQVIYEETFNTTDQNNLGNPSEKVLNVSLANMNVARYKTGAWQYNLLDHLGSTKVITNAGGQAVDYLDYEAFGKNSNVITNGGFEAGTTG
ncbi:MAG: hypothetical protein ACM3WV_03705 [Bacillota bacterium]